MNIILLIHLYPIKKYLGTAKDKITIEKDGIWHVEDAQVNESLLG